MATSHLCWVKTNQKGTVVCGCFGGGKGDECESENWRNCWWGFMQAGGRKKKSSELAVSPLSPGGTVASSLNYTPLHWLLFVLSDLPWHWHTHLRQTYTQEIASGLNLQVQASSTIWRETSIQEAGRKGKLGETQRGRAADKSRVIYSDKESDYHGDGSDF